VKITNYEEQRAQEVTSVNLTEIFLKLQETYRTINVLKIDEEVFMFRALGRSEFRSIANNTQFNDLEKEEIICQACTVWPENYDFENGDAGTPSTLSKAILECSHLDSIESRMAVTQKARDEMFELDNQVTCIINEAFPQFDIEEIEQWDLEKTAKYLSRAEWKLQNLRGLNMAYDPYNGQAPQEQQPQSQQPPERVAMKTPKTEEVGSDTSLTGKPKEKLTPEKLAELRARYPEIYGKGELVTNIDQMKDSVDPTSAALRTGW
jgi:hypothetical protein